jgi:hypothetical protein
MIYVMSDIHGQKRRFDSVMKQINLQPDDMKCQKSGRHSRRKTCQCSSILVLLDTLSGCFLEI